MFTDELAKLNKDRIDKWNSMTAEQRYKAGLQKHRPRGGKQLTEEQIAERNGIIKQSNYRARK